MKRWSIVVSGFLVALAVTAIEPGGIGLGVAELSAVRAGDDYTRCMHKGPETGNCEDCENKIKCEYRQWLGIEPWVSTVNCLQAKTVWNACDGKKTVYSDDKCSKEPNEFPSCIARVWQNIDVVGCSGTCKGP